MTTAQRKWVWDEWLFHNACNMLLSFRLRFIAFCKRNQFAYWAHYEIGGVESHEIEKEASRGFCPLLKRSAVKRGLGRSKNLTARNLRQ